MKIVKSVLPTKSLLFENRVTYHYVDSYSALVADKDDSITPLNLAKAFFSARPKWIGVLFTLRNKIVSVFGLKTPDTITDRAQALTKFKGTKGERIGLFQVYDSNDSEMILGEDDKHLNFRVSLCIAPIEPDFFQKKITISTVVTFNNWFGKLYFIPVKPFHKLIVYNMLKGILKELEHNTEN